MKSVPAELLYVLMIVAIVLFQFLMKRFGPQESQEPQEPQEPEEPARDERLAQISEELEDAPPASAASGMAAGHSVPVDAPRVASARRRFSRSSLMGTRREVQNAVVIATILGRCRAFEPHDVRQ